MLLLTSCQQTCMTYTIAVCTVKTPDDGQRNCPKYVEFYSKNKFEKLMHLVGFIIRNLYQPVFLYLRDILSFVSSSSKLKRTEVSVARSSIRI